jgi:hypothetical protein
MRYERRYKCEASVGVYLVDELRCLDEKIAKDVYLYHRCTINQYALCRSPICVFNLWIERGTGWYSVGFETQSHSP